MPIIARGKSQTFTPAPEGLHRAVCCDVVDLGMVDGQFGRKHKVRLYWQIEERMDSDRPFLVAKTYTLSLHKKSALRPDLESWRGKPFTEEEAEGFDLERLLGQNCQINVTHRTTQDGTFANIQAVVPAAKNMKPLQVEDYIRKCKREDWVEPETDEAPETGDYDPPQNVEAEEEIPF